MAIPLVDLRLRTGNAKLTFAPTGILLRLDYEVFHRETGDVVESGSVTQRVSKIGDLDLMFKIACGEIDSIFYGIRAIHKPLSIVGGLSAFDVNLVCEQWLFAQHGDSWTLTHPLSGVFTERVFADTLIDRVNEIRSLTLSPPAWVQASSSEGGKLTVCCAAVTGAEYYAVYNDLGSGTFEHLGDAPSHSGGTVNVLARTYMIRVGGVVDGVVGILARPVTVTVEEGVAAVADIEPSQFRPSVMVRLKRVVVRLFARIRGE